MFSRKLLVPLLILFLSSGVSAELVYSDSFEHQDASDGSDICANSRWIQDFNCFNYDSGRSVEGSYSAYFHNTNNDAGTPLMHRDVFDQDEKIDKISAWYRETSDSHGHAITVRGEGGSRVAGFYTNNPEFGIYDQNGFHGGQVSGGLCGGSSYNTWYQVNLTFDWSANTFSFVRNDGCAGSGYSLGDHDGISSVYIDNADDENWETGNLVGWVDDIQVYSEGLVSICDSRGPSNECISSQEHNLSGESLNVSAVFEMQESAVFEARFSSATLNLSNSSTISGIWQGSFDILTPVYRKPVLAPGAEFRPENGNIVVGR